MRLTLPKLGRTSCLISTLQELDDTAFVQDELDNFLERAKNPIANSMMGKIVHSGLVEAATFPIAAPCPELVYACMNRYDASNRYIRANNGDMLVRIDREIVMAAIGVPHKESYEDWSIGTSYAFFSEKKSVYRSVIARN